jgi:hypothetical protein
VYLRCTFIRDFHVELNVLKRGVVILCGRMYQALTMRLLRSAIGTVSVGVFYSVGGLSEDCIVRRIYVIYVELLC